MPPLPPAAEAARQAAMRAQSRRNIAGALLAGTFVVGVFSYCIQAVDQDEITDRDVELFRKKRDLERQRDESVRR